MSRERPACRAAVIQALRFHYGFPESVIAEFFQVTRQTVHSVISDNGSLDVRWRDRERQQEAIEAARTLLMEMYRTYGIVPFLLRRNETV